MAKIIIQIEASVAALSRYADQLGYQPQVFDSMVNGEPQYVPNPVTKQQFLADSIKISTRDMLAKPSLLAIDKAVNDAKLAEKETVRTQIENAITVTLTA